MASKVLFEFGVSEGLEVCPTVHIPQYRKPELHTSFAPYKGTSSTNTDLPAMNSLLPALQENFAAVLEEYDISTSSAKPVIVCRRRCLKEIWCYSTDQTTYYKTTYRSPLTAYREGSCIFIDQERRKDDDAKAPEKSKLSVGHQFEEMCTTTPSGATPGVGCFTAVYHEVGDNRILCFGEVDCKKGKEYLELKASGSHPSYWPLTEDQRNFYFASMYLGAYSLLVRGHQNKGKNPRLFNRLDILEELDISQLGVDEAAFEKLLEERLNIIFERVTESDVKYLISWDDESAKMEVVPIA